MQWSADTQRHHLWTMTNKSIHENCCTTECTCACKSTPHTSTITPCKCMKLLSSCQCSRLIPYSLQLFKHSNSSNDVCDNLVSLLNMLNFGSSYTFYSTKQPRHVVYTSMAGAQEDNSELASLQRLLRVWLSYLGQCPRTESNRSNCTRTSHARVGMLSI